MMVKVILTEWDEIRTGNVGMVRPREVIVERDIPEHLLKYYRLA